MHGADFAFCCLQECVACGASRPDPDAPPPEPPIDPEEENFAMIDYETDYIWDIEEASDRVINAGDRWTKQNQRLEDLRQGCELEKNLRRGHGSTVTCLTGGCMPDRGLNKMRTSPNVGISGSADFSCTVWNLDTGKTLFKFSGHKAKVKDIHLDRETGPYTYFILFLDTK